jgi:hypothetical protein
MDELGIGISLDIFGFGDELWPPAADGGADDEEEEHAAASSATAAAPTAPRKTAPGRQRSRDEDLDMADLLRCPHR